MVRRKQRRRRASDDDIDPMAGTTNLVDAMLVLALGFLIFVVISWNMQSVIFSDMSQDQKQAVMESMKQVSEVTQGQELNDTPDTYNYMEKIQQSKSEVSGLQLVSGSIVGLRWAVNT